MVEVVHFKRCYPPWGQPGDVLIDRTTKWGNPYPMGSEAERDAVCNAYERYFKEMESKGILNISELFTANRLGCWCKPKRCHGDYLKHRIDQALRHQPLSPDNPPMVPRRLDPKSFGIKTMQKTLKSGSYINQDDDIVKTYKRKKKTKKIIAKRKVIKKIVKICRCK